MVKNIEDAEILFIEGDCQQILYHVYSKVAEGCSLISHPLAGSIKPEVNPYRSVVLSNFKTAADLSTLAMVEKCLEKVEGGVKDRIPGEKLAALAADFRIIDKYLLENALQLLNGSKV